MYICKLLALLYAVSFLLASSHSGRAPTWTGSTRSSEGKAFMSLSCVCFHDMKQDSVNGSQRPAVALFHFCRYCPYTASERLPFLSFLFLCVHPDSNSTQIIVPSSLTSITSSCKKFSRFSFFHLFFYPAKKKKKFRPLLDDSLFSWSLD